VQVNFFRYLLSDKSHFWFNQMEQPAHPLAQGAALQQLAKVHPSNILCKCENAR
jgi:hypothetical protein